MLLLVNGSFGIIVIILILGAAASFGINFVMELLNKHKHPAGHAVCDADCADGFKHNPATNRCVPTETDLTVVVSGSDIVANMTIDELIHRSKFENTILEQLRDANGDTTIIADQVAVVNLWTELLAEKTSTLPQSPNAPSAVDLIDDVPETVVVDLSEVFTAGDEVVLVDAPTLTKGRYSPEEISTLETMTKAGNSFEEIAAALNRSVASVKRKIKKLVTA